MLLRRISQHVKNQNWIAVLLDFVIVVIGVGVAMMGQQWLSDRHQRADMALAETALERDLLGNYMYAKERLSVSDCRVQAYQAITAQLLEPGESWTGMPRSRASNELKTALPLVLRSPSRIWGSPTWDAALARGTFNQMDDERRSELDGIFRQTRNVDHLERDIHTLQGRLKTLAVSTVIGQSDRLRYYDMLGELDDKSAYLEAIVSQIIGAIELVGIDLSSADRQDAYQYLKQFNENGISVYGDCYVPAQWPIIDGKFSEESAP